MSESLPILYSSARSPHCFKVSLVLHELGVDFDRVEVDLRAKEQKTPAFLALNPLGQVPVYRDDAGVHIDSLVIMRHLDARHGPSRLFPHDEVALEDVLRWIDLSSTAMRDVSHQLYWQLIEPPEGGPDPQIVAQRRQEGMELLATVESALSRGDGWLTGTFGAGDLSVFAWLYGFRRFDLPTSWEAFPHLRTWLDRVSARPSFAASYGRVGRPFDRGGRAAERASQQ